MPLKNKGEMCFLLKKERRGIKRVVRTADPKDLRTKATVSDPGIINCCTNADSIRDLIILLLKPKEQ